MHASLRLSFVLISVGALSACTVTATVSSGDAIAPGDDGGYVAPDSGSDVATGDTGTLAETGDDSGTVAEVGTTFMPPPDMNAYYARFIVATSAFENNAPFDICFAPWDGVSATPDSAYQGPLANSLGVTSFTAPEVTNYFPLTGMTAATNKLRVRLVVPGTDCSAAARFMPTAGGTVRPLTIKDDATDQFVVGYNSAIIYGSGGVDPTTMTFRLTALDQKDPINAPTVPTLQFFNGFSGMLGVTVKGTDGNSYTFGTGAVDYASYTSLPLSTASINISGLTLTPVGGAAVTLNVSTTFSPGYYWAFAYGTPTSLHIYLCPDSTKIASPGDVAIGVGSGGCSVY